MQSPQDGLIGIAVPQMEKQNTESPNVLPNNTCYGPNQGSALSLLKREQAPSCRARSGFSSFYQMWFRGPQNCDTPFRGPGYN